MADAAIRIEEVFQGTENGQGEALMGELVSGFQKIGKALSSAFKGGKGLEHRMESYRYGVASRVPFHCEHIENAVQHTSEPADLPAGFTGRFILPPVPAGLSR